MTKIPIEIRIEKSKREIIELINKLSKEYELSFYILHYIIKEIYDEIENGRNNDIKEINRELEKKYLEEKKGDE